ncbi:MAG: hypothetical protein EXS13_11105 [Planctomycetes bacterium]|nr:hypothetical protein [Planctomycetota bacterium]
MRSPSTRSVLERVVALGAVLLPLPAWIGRSDGGQDNGQHDDLPEAVQSILGTWTGEWQMWGVDGSGAVVPKFKWTDRMVTTDVTRSADRIVIKTSNQMTFAGGPGSPRTALSEPTSSRASAR